MRYFFWSAAVALSLIAIGSAANAESARPEPTTAAIGGVKLVIAAPAGMVNPARDAPQIVETALQLVPPASRLLGVFIPEQELKRQQRGQLADLSRYAIAQTARAAENDNITPQQFADVRKYLRDQNAAQLAGAQARTQARFDNKAAQFGDKLDDPSLALTLSQVGLLGVVQDTPSAITLLSTGTMNMRVKGETRTRFKVYSTTVLKVRGKLMFLYVYSPYNGEADALWVKNTAIAWKSAIAASN